MMTRKTLLGTTAAALFAASASHAAIYIPVTPPAGAVSATVFGINDNNEIAGSYTDSAGVEHGFFGPLNGKYSTFDYGKGQSGTEPRAISNDGSITGFAPGGAFAVGEEFFRSTGGKIKTFNINGSPFDGVAQGMNANDVNMGDYSNISGVTQGYLGANGKYKKDFKLHIKGWQQNSPRQMNDSGIVAGYFIDKSGGEHGFIQQGRTVQVIDYPQAGTVLTVLEGINDNGIASGQWEDSAGNPHGFTYNSGTAKFKVVDPGDGSTFQQAWGLNKKGLVALSTSNGVSYIYCPLRASKCPGGGSEVKTLSFHVIAGTSLQYDEYGRTGRNLQDIRTITARGKIR